MRNQEGVLASIHFFVIDKDEKLEVVSLAEAPFGSVEIHEDGAFDLKAFMLFVVQTLRERNVHSIIIKDCISIYRPDVQLKQLFTQLGFSIREKQLNHHIAVDSSHLAGKMHRMEQKRLRKCLRAGFQFRQEPLPDLKDHYHFLQHCRRQKGWELSASLEDIQQLSKLLPHAYRLFSVYDGQRRVAASLSIAVNEHVLYDFYHDSLQEYRQYSPVTLLLDGMYQYCQQERIAYIDMGTSETLSLQAFKSHVGGIASPKITYQLDLHG
ncbi:MAG: GNAT family N-acetyltransferase [Cyclobacteriaceae bacterium]